MGRWKRAAGKGNALSDVLVMLDTRFVYNEYLSPHLVEGDCEVDWVDDIWWASQYESESYGTLEYGEGGGLGQGVAETSVVAPRFGLEELPEYADASRIAHERLDNLCANLFVDIHALSDRSLFPAMQTISIALDPIPAFNRANVRIAITKRIETAMGPFMSAGIKVDVYWGEFVPALTRKPDGLPYLVLDTISVVSSRFHSCRSYGTEHA